MTVPACADTSTAPPRTTTPARPTSIVRWDLARAIAHVARHPEVADGTFRFYAVVVTAFENNAFTGSQAAVAADVPLKTAWQYLGVLASAGLLTSRRAIVGETDDGRPVRERIYRARAVAA